MFAIGYRSAATGLVSFYFVKVQQHLDPGDLCNGTPFASYVTGKIFLDSHRQKISSISFPVHRVGKS